MKPNTAYEELYIFKGLLIFEGFILENVTNIKFKRSIKYCYVHKRICNVMYSIEANHQINITNEHSLSNNKQLLSHGA